MSSNIEYFLKKTLGEDFMESLSKVELWKPGTKSTVDHEEIRTALQIVPRTIMALLIRELAPMSIGDNKIVQLFIDNDSRIVVTKHERDVYSGEVIHENKKITEFKFRSIPGVGLVIMSAFELYDMENLINSAQQPSKEASDKVQKIIEERLALHDLIGKVVDKKIMEKDAVHQLVLAKLTETLKELDKNRKKVAELTQIQQPILQITSPEVNKKEDAAIEESKKTKGSPVKDFLEQRKKKLDKSEYTIQMSKGEMVDCPDCRKNIFDGKIFSGCICLGDDMSKKVFIKKSKEGIKVRFSKGWDEENIEMLLEVLRRKHG